MDRLGISHQTLKEFIDMPFGVSHIQKNLKYEDKYQLFKRNNRIKIESAIEIDKNYFIHLKVPSESQKGLSYYDVVVQFFTTDKKIEKELSVKNYYVQFFSNSPGFVYKYAALYKLEGYLIESLYDKFDGDTLNILPDKANKTYELYFDSSIYYACRYLWDNRLSILGKLSLRIIKKKPPKNFFADIQSFSDVNLSKDITNMESSIKKEIIHDNKLSLKAKQELRKNKVIADKIQKKEKQDLDIHRIKAKTHTGTFSTTKRIKPNRKKMSKKKTSE